MAKGLKTGGRKAGTPNQADKARAFVAHIERLLKDGGHTDGLANLICRQLMNPMFCNPLLIKLLEYKYGKPSEDSDSKSSLTVVINNFVPRPNGNIDIQTISATSSVPQLPGEV